MVERWVGWRVAVLVLPLAVSWVFLLADQRDELMVAKLEASSVATMVVGSDDRMADYSVDHLALR